MVSIEVRSCLFGSGDGVSPQGIAGSLKSSRQNIPQSECRLKEKRSARVAEWEEEE